jgi:integrase/recombinase XerD
MTAALRLVRDDGTDGTGLPPLEAYELYLRGAGRSERWVVDSLYTLRRLQVRAGKDVDACAAIDVSRFLGAPQLSIAARSTYFGYINAFYRWWAQEGGVHVTARLPRPRVPKGVPHPISSEQLRRLLALRMHRRTRVMILLAAFAGLRVHEIAKVRGEDFDLAGRTLRVTGKGNVTATLPLHPLLAEAALRMPRRGWWFPANSRRPGEHVLRKGVSDIIGNAMRRGDITGGTAHALRHWFGTNLVASGTDLRTAQTLLRHSSLQTTALYVQVADEKRGEAIDRLDPFGQGPGL